MRALIRQFVAAENLKKPLSDSQISDMLKEQGIEPERPPYSIREGGPRLCFVRDPDGYRIELIERTPG